MEIHIIHTKVIFKYQEKKSALYGSHMLFLYSFQHILKLLLQSFYGKVLEFIYNILGRLEKKLLSILVIINGLRNGFSLASFMIIFNHCSMANLNSKSISFFNIYKLKKIIRALFTEGYFIQLQPLATANYMWSTKDIFICAKELIKRQN